MVRMMNSALAGGKCLKEFRCRQPRLGSQQLQDPLGFGCCAMQAAEDPIQVDLTDTIKTSAGSAPSAA